MTTLWEVLEARPLTASGLTPAPPLAGDVSGHILLPLFISFPFLGRDKDGAYFTGLLCELSQLNY